MRQLEAFTGVRVLNYALMSNHFHLLCEVPQARELSEAELLDRIQAGYGPALRSYPARVVWRFACKVFSVCHMVSARAPVALFLAKTLKSRILPICFRSLSPFACLRTQTSSIHDPDSVLVFF